MVTSWIINSMSKEIADTFMYCASARKLWLELEEQFGESNGPHIYQVQRQIASIEQGSQTVVMYYSRLKHLWEELNVLQPIPQCTSGIMDKCECSVSTTLANLISQNKLVQFLMGLNQSFDSIRSQILVLDPLPSVNKAYSMVLRVEKQRIMQTDLAAQINTSEKNSAMPARTTQHSNSKNNSGRRNQKKDDHICDIAKHRTSEGYVF